MTDTFLALRAHIYVTLYSYFEKGCRQKNITRQSRKALLYMERTFVAFL